MFWFLCDCWALCKAMTVWSISGTLHKTPLDRVRGATRVVRSVRDLNPQTAFSVILTSTCCAPRMNVLALVLSISTKARTMSVKDATLRAELVKVKSYTLLWPEKGYQNTHQGLSKHLSSTAGVFLTLCSKFGNASQEEEISYTALPISPWLGSCCGWCRPLLWLLGSPWSWVTCCTGCSMLPPYFQSIGSSWSKQVYEILPSSPQGCLQPQSARVKAAAHWED